MSNTAGVLAGVISTAATGYILASGTWNDVWSSAIFFYLVGTVIWNLFATGVTSVIFLVIVETTATPSVQLLFHAQALDIEQQLGYLNSLYKSEMCEL